MGPVSKSKATQGAAIRTREQNTIYFGKQGVPHRTLHASGSKREGEGPDEADINQVLGALQELEELQREVVGESGKQAFTANGWQATLIEPLQYHCT